MQQPTCTRLRVRTPADAHVIFHAVYLKALPMVARRLDAEERRSISSGCVFVWEERGPNAEATGLGIERWTDSIRWGPSRVRDEFLFYHEKEVAQIDREFTSDSDTTLSRRTPRSHRGSLIKQTYSVFVETSRGRRKWHLIAYFTQDTLDHLQTIDDHPQLGRLTVPPGKYKSARSAKSSRHHHDLMMPPYGYPSTSSQTQHLTHGSVREREPGSHPLIIRPSRSEHQENDGYGSASLKSLDERLSPDVLAPLEYLQNIPPPRRHPIDEEALMSFTLRSCWSI